MDTEVGDIEVEREDRPGHGRYVIHLPGGLEAEMTFRKHGTEMITIDHTYTPPEFRGQNLAMRLMQRTIDDARRDGVKVRPVCSYAVAQFRRHPEWRDLLAQ
ncbi:MAG TPA: GNAT family N-acetyltransferase [Devosia sp.]|nr:GNAT family N-acetyltransferase [Devosia sp.]